jgi:DNA-directed RNA polymerase specialized sigma24 family protein
VEDEPLWPLFRAVAEAGEPAWPALAGALAPQIEAMARRQPIGRLRDREDTPREIVTRTLERLHAHEFQSVRKLCAQDPPPPLRAWLRLVVKRSAIDYMRDVPEYQRATPNRPFGWISLAPLDSLAPSPGPSSLAVKRQELTAFVDAMVERAIAEHAAHGDAAFGTLAIEWKVQAIHVRRLARRGRVYLAVLNAVLDGRSHSEVAAVQGMTEREVDLTVRYLRQLLAARGFND